MLPRIVAAAFALFATLPLNAAEKETRVFELRVYWAAPGKLDALNARFKDHTLKLFEKHGMTNIGYFTPIAAGDDRLIYIVAHKDKAAADASWKAFSADSDWQSAYKASETNGKLVNKLERVYLSATDFSPAIAPATGKVERVFELRTYIASPNNLPALNGRFRDHTTKLFEKHGMTNVAYWNLAESDKTTNAKLMMACSPKGEEKVEAKGEEAAKPTALVYLMAHRSAEAQKKSFDEFRLDPVWLAARGETEKKAGGALTVKDGVKSLLMKPTEYSPMK